MPWESSQRAQRADSAARSAYETAEPSRLRSARREPCAGDLLGGVPDRVVGLIEIEGDAQRLVDIPRRVDEQVAQRHRAGGLDARLFQAQVRR